MSGQKWPLLVLCLRRGCSALSIANAATSVTLQCLVTETVSEAYAADQMEMAYTLQINNLSRFSSLSRATLHT